MIRWLDKENADLDLTNLVIVLTHSWEPANDRLCLGCVVLGDGTKDLDGSGGIFELVITVDGQTIQPSPQLMCLGTEVKSTVWTVCFSVPGGQEVVLRIKSPNAGDSDVDVTAYLFECTEYIRAVVCRFLAVHIAYKFIAEHVAYRFLAVPVPYRFTSEHVAYRFAANKIQYKFKAEHC